MHSKAERESFLHQVFSKDTQSKWLDSLIYSAHPLEMRLDAIFSFKFHFRHAQRNADSNSSPGNAKSVILPLIDYQLIQTMWASTYVQFQKFFFSQLLLPSLVSVYIYMYSKICKQPTEHMQIHTDASI